MATTTAAKKGKTRGDRVEAYRALVAPEKLEPGLALERETLPQLEQQLEQATTEVERLEAAERAAEDALGDADIRGKAADQAKAEAALRKAKEATERARGRVRALERAIPQQRELIQRLSRAAIEKIRATAAAQHARLTREYVVTMRRAAELYAEIDALTEAADQAVRRCAREAGDASAVHRTANLPEVRIGSGLGTESDPNSDISLGLRRLRGYGLDVGD